MRTKKEERAKIDDSRVRNMLDKLPNIRSQLASYHDDLRRIEHEVYEFNQKFSAAIRDIYDVEHFYPQEEKAVEEKPKSNIIPFSYPERYAGPGYKRSSTGGAHE
jgi:predicted  nucleic acid-binding Zn-ribbon protein